MLPKEHFIIGLVILPLLAISVNMYWLYLVIAIAANVLIDFDHYLYVVQKTKNFSIKNAYDFHFRHPKNVTVFFHIFHTVEAHLLVLAFGFFLHPVFFAVLLGMLLHSLTDILSMGGLKGAITKRQFWVAYWVYERVIRK